MYSPSADYAQSHSDSSGNFLRLLVYALASTFLYDIEPPLTYPYGEGRASLNGEGVQKEEQGKQTTYPLRHVDCVPR
jgi:hypothetical protein